jgi:hypothetical protein
MVNLAQAVLALCPTAILGPDQKQGATCVISATAGIVYWAVVDASGNPVPQPTAGQLAAVTPQQVQQAQAAAISNAGGTALTSATDPNAVGTRAAVTQLYTRVNDLAEGFRATLELICASANIAMPTASQVAARITSDRTANPVDVGATDPGTVSTSYGQRITQTAILQLIGGVLESGGGLPLGD